MNNLYLLGAIMAGLIAGSFFGMLIPRLHNNEKGIVAGRSHCPQCKHILKARNLIPVLSFAFQKGRCSFCRKKISIIYPLIELTTALAFGALYLQVPQLDLWLIWAIMFGFLILIFYYDLRYQEIHDAFMLPAILFALLAAIYLGRSADALVGSAIGGAFFALQWLVSKGRWVGSGDIRIGAFMGLMLGFQYTVAALFLSYVLGTIASIFLLATKKATKKSMIPLGPFLALASALTFFYGDRLIDWYLNLMV
ncbi:prepilin peptidase [Candidatus Peregrinibacteria bacterium]|nr:prepilin peptidase [Candidatus Peregrinibacteria bacterium]